MLQCGNHELPTYDPNGEDGKYSFVCLENGYKVPTKEWDLVKRVMDGKKSINLQMKLWSEDVGIMLMPKEIYTYCKDMPKWVYLGVLEQTKSRYMKEIGFIPTFIREGFNIGD